MKDLTSLSILPRTMVKGDIIPLKVTKENHWKPLSENKVAESPAINFADALNKALTKVNNQQVEAENLQQKMIADPRSVEAHTVFITAEKARMSLSFTKTLTDSVIRTYRELINLR